MTDQLTGLKGLLVIHVTAKCNNKHKVLLTYYLPLTKKEVNVFAHVCLSVYMLARLLKNMCMDLDEVLRVDTTDVGTW